VDEQAPGRLVRRYIDDIGNTTMVTLADKSDQQEPAPVKRVWFFAPRNRGYLKDHEQELDIRLACADAGGQCFLPVLLVSDRDTIERRARGLLGGAVQREMTMNMNYSPETDKATAQPRPPKPATEARQGVISGRVLLVLLVSTVLVVIMMALAYAIWV
jgi:hypothetical protein